MRYAYKAVFGLAFNPEEDEESINFFIRQDQLIQELCGEENFDIDLISQSFIEKCELTDSREVHYDRFIEFIKFFKKLNKISRRRQSNLFADINNSFSPQ